MALTFDIKDVPEEAVGLRLCKVPPKYDLVHYETIIFERGFKGVQTTLLRAAIAGTVGPIGKTCDPDVKYGWWADFINKDGAWFDTVSLDRGSFNSLKNRWMRCKIESADLAA